MASIGSTPVRSVASPIESRVEPRSERVGLACCLAFLRFNGVRVHAGDDDLVDIVMGVAEGRRSKAEVAVFLRERTKPPSPRRR